MQNFLNKFKYFILGGVIVLAGSVYAVQISVPSSNGAGFLLQSLTNGTYSPVSLTAGSNVTISTTTSNVTISATGGTFPFTVNSWGNSTTTTLGLLNGFLSTASSTISSALRLTSLTHPAILSIDSTGLVVATGTPNLTVGYLTATSSTATSTFAGAVKINTTSSNDNLLSIIASRNYSNSTSAGGMVNLTNTLNNREALVIYTGTGALTKSGLGVMRIENASTTFRGGQLYIKSASSDGADFEARYDSPNPDLEFKETDQVGTDGTGQFEIDVNNDLLRFNGRNESDSSFYPNVVMQRQADGGRLCIGCANQSGGSTEPTGGRLQVVGTTTVPYFTVDSTFSSINTGNILTISKSSGIDGYVGISSTTPFARLSVNPIAGDTVGFVVGSSTATQLSVSSVGFGTTTLSGLTISGSATSTSNVGFNLTNGCFAINGVCIGGGAGGGGYNLVQDEGTPLTARTTINCVGAGITCSDSGSVTTFTVTGSSFSGAINSVVTTDGSGNLQATGTQLTVGSILATTSAKSLFGGTIEAKNLITKGANATINLINTNDSSTMGGVFSLTYDSLIFGYTDTTSPTYNNQLYIGKLFAGSATRSVIGTSKKVDILTAGDLTNIIDNGYGLSSIGTTTNLVYPLTISSSTRPQLSLSAGAGLSQWIMRNAGGNLYFATTTVQGTATTSTSALTIFNNGGVALSTTTAGTLKVDANGLIWSDTSGGGGGYNLVQDEGTPLTARTTLNFVGTGVNCVDDTTKTTCTINAGAASAGGSDTQVQFNDGSSLGGAVNWIWNKTKEIMGVGTSTPWTNHKVSIATSTGQNLVLLTGDNDAGVSFRNIAGSLYVGTTSPTTGATSTSPSAFTVDYSSGTGKVGVSSTTPWGALGIQISDYSTPAFTIGTSTESGAYGILFHTTATSSTLVSNTVNGKQTEVGVRVGVGLWDYRGYGGLLDQFTVKGRFNTYGTLQNWCDNAQFTALSADGIFTACPGWYFAEDNTGTTAINVGNSYQGTRVSASTAAVNNDGAGVFFSPNTSTGWFTLASSTPVLETNWRMRNSTATTSIYMVGFSNINIAGTTYEAEPTVGCFFIASSTANIRAVSKTSNTAATYFDTGIASTSANTANGTGYQYRFMRVQGGNGKCEFFIQASGSNNLISFTSTTNVPSGTLLNAGMHYGIVSQNTSSGFDFFRNRFWWKDVLPSL